MAAVDPDLIKRFRTDLAGLNRPDGQIGLAVSGGPDSMAMLMLAAASLPGRVAAATIDHGLRPEAAAEAALVASACATLGIPHATIAVEVGSGGSVQANARQARYEALARWCRTMGLPLLATAHHADDQAETILMRLMRGSGLTGLSGIRPVRDLGEGVHLIRPLLGWRRSELAAVVADVETVRDPSNADARYDRVRVRTLLAEATDIEPLRLAAVAGHLAEADQAIDWIVCEAIRTRVERLVDGRIVADLEGLPREIRRRILSQLIADADSPVDGPTLEGAMTRIDQGLAASVGGLRLSRGHRIVIEKAPSRR